MTDLNSELISLPFRGPIDTDRVSRLFIALVTDLKNSSDRIQELETHIDVLADTLDSENSKIRTQQRSLRERVGLAESNSTNRTAVRAIGTFNNISVPDTRTFFASLGDDDFVLPGGRGIETASVDWSAGYATLRILGRRNLILFESQNGPVIPDGVKFSIDPNEGSGNSTSSSPEKMILSDEKDPYVRKVFFSENSTISRVESDIEITLPSGLQSGTLANLVEIAPYPSWWTNIDRVELISADGSSQELDLEEFGIQPLPNTLSIPIQASSVSSIKIRISTERFRFENGQKVFVYGLKRVGVYDATYSNRGFFTVRFKPPDGRKISAINTLEYNVTRRDLNDLTERDGSAPPSLVLKVDSVTGDVRENAYDSSQSPTGKFQGTVQFATSADFIDITGILFNPSGSQTPPRVYDIGAEVIIESDSTGSILTEGIPIGSGEGLTIDSFTLAEGSTDIDRFDFTWPFTFRVDKSPIFKGGRLLTPNEDYTWVSAGGNLVNSITLVEAAAADEDVMVFALRTT